LRDSVVAADDLGLPCLRALHAGLRWAPRGERLAALEQSLCERASRLATPRLLPLAVRGMPSAAVACAGLGVSARQLERICLAETGLTPRELRRIQRFQRSLRLIETHPGAPFAACAQAAGFADESHLCRDFRAIAGVTPGAFRRAHSTLTSAFIARDDVAFVQSERSASRQTRRPIPETPR
jgi:AraC-like DNA-binding protein